MGSLMPLVFLYSLPDAQHSLTLDFFCNGEGMMNLLIDDINQYQFNSL